MGRFRKWLALLVVVLGCSGVGTLFVGWATRDPIGAYRTYRGHRDAVYGVDFDDSATLVASGGEDGLRIWRLSNLETIHQAGGRILAVRFLTGGKHLVYADADRGIVICSVPDGMIRNIYGEPCSGMVMASSPDGRWIAGAFPNGDKREPNYRPEFAYIYVWDTQRKGNLTVLKGHEGPVRGLAIHPSKAILASYATDDTIRVWSLDGGVQIGQQGVPKTTQQEWLTDTHDALEFSASGDKLVQGTQIFSVKALEAKQQQHTLGLGAKCSSLSPDERLLASGGSDGRISIWNTDGHVLLARYLSVRNNSEIYSVSFSKDGKLLATGGLGKVPLFVSMRNKVPRNDNAVRLWQVDRQIQRGIVNP